MNDHYKTIKEEKTLKLLKRACDFLVDIQSPLKLNGKAYKKINFSHGQIINCMHHIAKTEERADGLLFGNESTISKSDRYKTVIADAKRRRAEKEAKNLDLEFERGEPDVLDMKLMINSMAAQIDALKEENASLDAIIKKAELREALEEKSGPINIHHKETEIEDQRIRELLTRLLFILSEEGILAIEPKRDGKSAVANLHLPDGLKQFCKLSELQMLNLEYKKDSDERTLVENKAEK